MLALELSDADGERLAEDELDLDALAELEGLKELLADAEDEALGDREALALLEAEALADAEVEAEGEILGLIDGLPPVPSNKLLISVPVNALLKIATSSKAAVTHSA